LQGRDLTLPDAHRAVVVEPIQPEALAGPPLPAVQPEVDELLTRASAPDSENPAMQGLLVLSGGREVAPYAREEVGDSDARQGRAEEDRMKPSSRGLCGDRFLDPATRRDRAVDEVGEQSIVVLGQDFRDRRPART